MIGCGRFPHADIIITSHFTEREVPDGWIRCSTGTHHPVLIESQLFERCTWRQGVCGDSCTDAFVGILRQSLQDTCRSFGVGSHSRAHQRTGMLGKRETLVFGRGRVLGNGDERIKVRVIAHSQMLVSIGHGYPHTMHRIFTTSFDAVYPLYLAKLERKGRTCDELDTVICWLTGYTPLQLRTHLDNHTTFQDFFAGAHLNANANKITGVVCGVRVEEVNDPLMQQIRYLDKLVDELAKGRAMEKVLRT